MKHFFKVFVFIAISFFTNPAIALALDGKNLSVDFVISPQTIGLDKKLIASVAIHPKDAGINAIEGSVFFDPTIVSFKNYVTHNSLVDLWILRPTVVSSGRIDFAGIMPGGVTSSGTIVELEFVSKNVGETSIELGEISLGLQSSAGQIARPENQKKSISVQQIGGSSIASDIKLDAGPVFYPAEIGRSSAIFDNNWFISFLAKNTSEYFVQESTYWSPRADDWVAIESPYVLQDQKLGKYVFIKARDVSGNETIMKISPQWYNQTSVWLVFALVASVIILIVGILMHKRNSI